MILNQSGLALWINRTYPDSARLRSDYGTSSELLTEPVKHAKTYLGLLSGGQVHQT